MFRITDQKTEGMNFFRKHPDFDEHDTLSVVNACKEKNPKAQRTLIKLYYGYVKSLALRYSADDQDADEIANDTFLKAFLKLDRFDPSQSFKTWIRTIAVNTAIDYYRKHLNNPVHQQVENLIMRDVKEDIVSRLSAEEILRLVRKLSPVYRMVFTLYVIEGYSHKEIAGKLGIKEGTSKSNLQDARRRLQAMILKTNPNLYLAYELKSLRPNEN